MTNVQHFTLEPVQQTVQLTSNTKNYDVPGSESMFTMLLSKSVRTGMEYQEFLSLY